MTAAWHQLLAAIPKDARVNRRPLATAELAKTTDTAAIAEWETLTVELSDGAAGLRIVTVTLDGRGRPLSASDLVLRRQVQEDGRVEVRTESIGGRIERDGRFFGTRWVSTGWETRGDEPDAGIESTPAQPSGAEVDKLVALVRELAKRRPPRPQRSARGRGRSARDAG